MSPDVLVVGAGPAGSVAALVLARAGVRVRLIDRARFPRPKLCGDTLNPGALATLDRLGLADGIRARALPVSGMIVTGPGGAQVAADYPAAVRGAAISRHDLDLLLVAAATAAGARLDQEVRGCAPLMSSRDPQRVTGARLAWGGREEPVSARVVIAADGRASRLATALRLSRFATSPRRWAFGAYFVGVEGQTTHGEMHIRRDGYTGIAPLPCGITNVCVVRDQSAARAHDVVGAAIAADPVLRQRFAAARQISPVVALGPLAIDASASGCAGMLLAGDAAGFVDPMTGDGMRFALCGGMLAAEAALHELEHGRPAYASLAAARSRAFAAKWRINRALRALVGSPTGVAIAAEIAARWHAPLRYLVGVAGDVRLAS